MNVYRGEDFPYHCHHRHTVAVMIGEGREGGANNGNIFSKCFTVFCCKGADGIHFCVEVQGRESNLEEETVQNGDNDAKELLPCK